jgi:hypothetical protein
VAQEPYEMLRGEKTIGIDPHKVVVIELAVEGLLAFPATNVGAEAHVADEVDIARLPLDENGADIVEKAERGKPGPTFKELSGIR